MLSPIPSHLASPIDHSLAPPEVISLIGNTPLIKVTRLNTGLCDLFLKDESKNPSGSIKDRIGVSIIEAAEREGKLQPGGTIIEATAGNTGLGLALVARAKGYRVVLVVPDKMATEKILHLKALGAEIHLTRSDVGKGHPEYYQDYAARLAREIPNAFFADQFNNPNNPLAHETTTGPEIWEQTHHKVDAIVCGVGSSGTITGLKRYFEKKHPNINIEFVLADPKGSILVDYVKTGKVSTDAGSWAVEGIGEDFIPNIADLSGVKEAYSISDQESIDTAHELARSEGILAGSSTGTLLAAALRYCRAQSEPKRVVTFICDTGTRYLSKIYNETWLRNEGLLKRPRLGDLRDIIGPRFEDGGLVTVSSTDTLATAFKRMRDASVSQLPVIEQNQLVGIIDESDLLFKVINHQDAFGRRVESAMTSQIKTLAPNASLNALKSILDQGLVAVVKDADQFYGLITRSDLLNHLRLTSSIHAPDIEVAALDHPIPPNSNSLIRDDKLPKTTDFATRVIHAGQTADPYTGAVNPPIYLSSTYKQISPGQPRIDGLDYSRSSNPTRTALETCVADLESGAQGFAFASGLAAISTVLELVDTGSHIIASNDLYGGTYRLFDGVRKKSAGLSFSFVDLGDLEKLTAAIRPETRMVWVETPTNPMLKLADLSAIAKICRQHGIIAVADNTFATPYIQRPLEHGFDIVVHSTTKYMNGHSDIIGGIAVVGAAEHQKPWRERLGYLQNAIGSVAGSFDSFLALRGVKTLAIRMERHSHNALELAKWLENNTAVKKVVYPGLPSHPQHELAQQQMSHFGGMISVELNTNLEGTIRFLENCQLFTLAESLGGVESLIEHPATMTHASIPADQRAELGISDSLVRLSVGIEDIGDLKDDLTQAFKSIHLDQVGSSSTLADLGPAQKKRKLSSSAE